MAAKADAETKKEDVSLNQRLNDFIQKNRKYLLTGLVAILVILAGLIIISVAREKIQEKAISEVDALNTRYEDLRLYINSEEPEAAEKQADISALLEDISAFTGRKSGYAAARAWYIGANIYTEQKNWTEAEKAWSSAADAAGKTYLAPIAVFNAGVAAEEQGNIDAAIGYYTRALSYGDSVPSAARAQFSVARLEESRNNTEAALAAYRELLSKWPDDALWSNLAHNRILLLSKE